MTTDGPVFLANGFEAAGPVDLSGAKIGGQLSCIGAKFLGAETALNANSMTTEGPVFLSGEFEAAGTVDLNGAEISGQLDCSGGKFRGAQTALNGYDLTTEGPVFLRGNFEAAGAVMLNSAKIGGDLECIDGTFSGKPWALSLQKACVTGIFFWMPAPANLPTGLVDLTSAEVGDLFDDVNSWPKGGTILDGFRYGRIIGASTSYATRKEWLERQWREHLTNDFKPQPFEQLGNFYRIHGHYSDARRVAILKNDLMGKTGEAKWYARLLHRLYGAFLGYGYAPLRAFRLVPVFLVLGPLIFFAAYRYGAMVPNDPFVLRSDGWMYCISQEAATDVTATDCWLTWTQSLTQKNRAGLLDPPVRGRDFPEFHAAAYAFDTFVPFVNLHQETRWIPDAERGPKLILPGVEISVGAFARAYLWFHIIAGWIITALFAASVGGLVKKDV